MYCKGGAGGVGGVGWCGWLGVAVAVLQVMIFGEKKLVHYNFTKLKFGNWKV